IGKNGKVIGAIRTLLSQVASRDGRKALIEVVE
ncbi:MAG: RNA-binding protein, partial [Verrucomicrobia bacterium]|nr:RNA-binding protein [Verrucomicrobiota bacterium]